MIDDILVDTADKMTKATAHTRADFSSIRTGRATPALVEKLKVEYYGSDVQLQQLAGFSVPEARVLVIAPYDKGAIKAIERALQNSDLGITPSNDGQVIRLTFPQLTSDRRKELVKVARHKAEDGRVATRNLRRSARHELEALEKNGEISSDELERAEKDLEKLTQEHVADIDHALARKEQELLEV
ncbi:MAG TPA: ribosome recycling factor [Acidimicrobiales bacterium]|nr:ribosome recycling factor [Acidimicrobiales bacterium]